MWVLLGFSLYSMKSPRNNSALFLCYKGLVYLFSTIVPLTDKTGSWFLPAKSLKATCGRVTF